MNRRQAIKAMLGVTAAVATGATFWSERKPQQIFTGEIGRINEVTFVGFDRGRKDGAITLADLKRAAKELSKHQVIPRKDAQGREWLTLDRGRWV